MTEKVEKKASGGIKKMTLINVIASMFVTIFLIDSIVPAAGNGAPTIIWYVILGIAFYIPYGLITAEFSSKIPDEGGVYAWVKKTLGIGTSKRVAWYYWVNVGIWAPSIAVYIAQLIQFMWYPDVMNPDNMFDHGWQTMAIAIAFMWASLAFSYFPIADNQKLYSSATICKVVVILFLVVGMFTQIGQGKPSHTDFSTIPADFADVGAMLLFLPALVYNILGLEAIAGEASQIKNPKKTMARAAIITTLALLVFYIITTVVIQYTVNIDGIDLSATIVSLTNSFGMDEMGSKILVNLLAILFLWSMFVETMGWVSGANAGISEAAENKEVPAIFKWQNKRGMPFKSTIILGIVGTIELVLFTGLGMATDGNISGNLFWSLFAASSNVLFISYILMFIAYVKAKWTGELDKYTGFSIKRWVGIAIGSIATLVLAITWFLLLWNPDYDVLTQTVPIIGSVSVSLIAGEICFILANIKYRKSWKKSKPEKAVN